MTILRHRYASNEGWYEIRKSAIPIEKHAIASTKQKIQQANGGEKQLTDSEAKDDRETN